MSMKNLKLSMQFLLMYQIKGDKMKKKFVAKKAVTVNIDEDLHEQFINMVLNIQHRRGLKTRGDVYFEAVEHYYSHVMEGKYEQN